MLSPESRPAVVPVVNLNSTRVTEKRFQMFNEWVDGLQNNPAYAVTPQLTISNTDGNGDFLINLSHTLKLPQVRDEQVVVIAAMCGDGTINTILNILNGLGEDLDRYKFLFVRHGATNVYGDRLGHDLSAANLNHILEQKRVVSVDLERVLVKYSDGNEDVRVGLLSVGMIHPFIKTYEAIRGQMHGRWHRRIQALRTGLPELKSVVADLTIVKAS